MSKWNKYNAKRESQSCLTCPLRVCCLPSICKANFCTQTCSIHWLSLYPCSFVPQWWYFPSPLILSPFYFSVLLLPHKEISFNVYIYLPPFLFCFSSTTKIFSFTEYIPSFFLRSTFHQEKFWISQVPKLGPTCQVHVQSSILTIWSEMSTVVR